VPTQDQNRETKDEVIARLRAMQNSLHAPRSAATITRSPRQGEPGQSRRKRGAPPVPEAPPSLWTVFTLDLVAALSGSRTFERGQDYYLAGRVRDLEVMPEDDEATAAVDGTEEYEVWIHLDPEGEPGYSCDCPMGTGGDFCKHCVAVALAVIDQPNPNDSAAEADSAGSRVGRTDPGVPRGEAEPAPRRGNPVVSAQRTNEELTSYLSSLERSELETMVLVVLAEAPIAGAQIREQARQHAKQARRGLGPLTVSELWVELDDLVGSLVSIIPPVGAEAGRSDLDGDPYDDPEDDVYDRDDDDAFDEDVGLTWEHQFPPSRIERLRGWADDLQFWIDAFNATLRADPAVAGDLADLASVVYHRVGDAIVDGGAHHQPLVVDERGAVRLALVALVLAHGAACRAINPPLDQSVLAGRLFTLAMEVAHGPFAAPVAGYVDLLGVDGRAEYERLLDAHRQMLPSGPDVDTVWIPVLTRLREEYIALAELDGDGEKELAVRRDPRLGPIDVGELVTWLVRAGRTEDAADELRGRIVGAGSASDRARCRQDLIALLSEGGDTDGACSVALDHLLDEPSNKAYDRLLMAAGPDAATEWSALAARALERSLADEAEIDQTRTRIFSPRGRGPSLAGVLVSVLVAAGKLDQAASIARRYPVHSAVVVALATTLADAEPAEAGQLFLRIAETEILGATNGRYAEAITQLHNAADCLDRVSDPGRFAAEVRDIRRRHKAKRNLQAALAAEGW